jgi:hypothetical protein
MLLADRDPEMGQDLKDDGITANTVEGYQATFQEQAISAENNHALTDDYGNILVQFDPKEEARIRLKIDLYIIPTV